MKIKKIKSELCYSRWPGFALLNGEWEYITNAGENVVVYALVRNIFNGITRKMMVEIPQKDIDFYTIKKGTILGTELAEKVLTDESLIFFNEVPVTRDFQILVTEILKHESFTVTEIAGLFTAKSEGLKIELRY